MAKIEPPVSAARALARELKDAMEATRQVRSNSVEEDGALARAEQTEANVLARVKAHNKELKAAKAKTEAVKARAKGKSKKVPKPARALVPCPTCGMCLMPSKFGSLPAHLRSGAEAWCHGGSSRKTNRTTSPYLSKSVSVRTVSGGSPGLGKRS